MEKLLSLLVAQKEKEESLQVSKHNQALTFQKGAFGSLHSGHPQSNFILNYQEVSIMFGYQNCSNDGEKLLKFEIEAETLQKF